MTTMDVVMSDGETDAGGYTTAAEDAASSPPLSPKESGNVGDNCQEILKIATLDERTMASKMTEAGLEAGKGNASKLTENAQQFETCDAASVASNTPTESGEVEVRVNNSIYFADFSNSVDQKNGNYEEDVTASSGVGQVDSDWTNDPGFADFGASNASSMTRFDNSGFHFERSTAMADGFTAFGDFDSSSAPLPLAFPLISNEVPAEMSSLPASVISVPQPTALPISPVAASQPAQQQYFPAPIYNLLVRFFVVY